MNDVIRFGRVTFKVTELVITPEEIDAVQDAIEALQSGQFKVCASQAELFLPGENQSLANESVQNANNQQLVNSFNGDMS